MPKSETPIKDRVGGAYETGAKPATPPPAGQLHESGSWSTGDMNLKNQQREAHEQRLASEQKHLDMIYPFFEPKGSFTSKKKGE